MSMKPPIVTAATLLALFAGELPAADPQLLNLVMPDAKVLAGVNVDQAKTSPFGVYVLTQMQSQVQAQQHLQQLTALTGFDPTRDVHELLFAAPATPGNQSGLALARGAFDAMKIQAAALVAGALTESYQGVTLIEDPKQTHAVAFLDSTLAVAGDVASVKGAIDRQTLATPLPAAVITTVNQWSGNEDAWVVLAVPPASLKPPVNAPNPPNPAVQNALQNIQQAAGGVKFGAQIVLTGQAQTDTPDNATMLANVGQFLISLAQMQAQQSNPQLAAALPSMTIAATGNQVNVALSVPEAAAEQAVKTGPPATPQTVRRGVRRL